MPEVATDKMSPSPPRDKHQLVYIICCWLGIGMLLPWNFFSQVNGYWMYKFRNIPNDTIQSEKQKFWGSNLALVSMAPNFTFLFINALIGHKLRYNLSHVYHVSFTSKFFNIAAYPQESTVASASTFSSSSPP